MAIDNFIPEVWASALLVPLRKQMVFAGPDVVNHDYEGNIQEYGDTVHITAVGDVTVNDYEGTVEYEDIDDAGLLLDIDQQKYFGKKFGDVDKAQSLNGGAVMAQVMAQAAYRLSDTADQYVASFYTQISSGSVLDAVTELGGSSPTADELGEAAYDLLVDLGVTLTEANVPKPGRYAVVPPWYYGCLLKAHAFINAEKYGSTDALINGEVGRAAGFTILESNNCAVPSDGTNVIQVGTPMATSFANQIVKTEALRDPDSFSDLVRGLHVYGAKVTYPDGLACVTVTRPS